MGAVVREGGEGIGGEEGELLGAGNWGDIAGGEVGEALLAEAEGGWCFEEGHCCRGVALVGGVWS